MCLYLLINHGGMTGKFRVHLLKTTYSSPEPLCFIHTDPETVLQPHCRLWIVMAAEGL